MITAGVVVSADEYSHDYRLARQSLASTERPIQLYKETYCYIRGINMPYPWEAYESSSANCQTCYDLDPECIPQGASTINPGRPSDHFALRQVRLKNVLKEGKHVWFNFPGAAEAQQRCLVCHLIVNALGSFHDNQEIFRDPNILVYIDGSADGSMPLGVRFMHDKLDTGASWLQMPNTRDERAKLHLPDFGLELYTLKDHSDENYPAIGTSLHISDNFRSEKCLTTIQRWMKECMDSHPLCQIDGKKPLPKRVVDVGPRDGTKAPALYVTDGETQSYAALSHCWGNSSLLRTTKSTLESRIHGIKWSELSTTFQEAILVTRDLGLRYLWIDSLCIVQDDAADWEEQAMKMGDIYASAYVTISATGSSDGSGGLLRTPGTWSSDGFSKRRKWPLMRKNQQKYFARVHLEEDAFVKGTPVTRDGSLGYPLLSRAWCFQERILSARVLHYTPGGIFYECRTGSRCETRLTSEPSLKSVYASALQTAETQTVEERLRVWGTMLRDYTTKMLTFQKDTLPALSSVASQFAEKGMGRYLAGLWEEGLVASLLWESILDADLDFGASRGNVFNFSRPDSFIAPTFSWASRIGPIKAFNPMARKWTPCASIVEAECKPRGIDPYGLVSRGHVKVRGRLVEASFHSKACMFGTCADFYRGAYKNSRRGVHLVAESYDPKCHIVASGLPLLDITVDSEQDARLPVGEKVYCLQLVEFPEQQFGTWFDAIGDTFSKLRASDKGGPADYEWRVDRGDDDDIEMQYRGRWAPGYHSPIRRRSDSMLRHRYKADIEAGLLPRDAVPARRERFTTTTYNPADSPTTSLSPLSEPEEDPDEDDPDELSLDIEWYESDEERNRMGLRGGGISSDEDAGAAEVNLDDDDRVSATEPITWAEKERRFLTAASRDGEPSTTCGVLILRQAADGTYTRVAANSRFPTNMFTEGPIVEVTIQPIMADQEETHVALPSATIVRLSGNATLQPPLTRRGYGPGLIIVIPGDPQPGSNKEEGNSNASGDRNPKTLDPLPRKKWAEEGYAVVQLTFGVGEQGTEEWDVGTALDKAIEALAGLETCDVKDRFGLIGKVTNCLN
ncbi:hypothetical protein O1611_g4307 [Lasiodiplodia mahajangana]|uniref:Uncharacterized protein n=1 Tax=Lasiodiplodia mahajangana TaxID=1108764 RepID=A0ACC2JPG1_9PEZI|nr:hypothetical protein O1611_g4307 [Lasiodiplodia mahajangana]